MANYLDLAGLTTYDAKLKQWINGSTVDITNDEILALFATYPYQMVDLGLPSGLKWADRNVGASSPQDAGLYFSWGNVDGHTVDENGNVVDYSFDSTTYSTSLGGQYTGITLDAEHDAATVNMGSDWRMPTKDETNELVEGTTQTVDTENGGMIFTSKTNGNSIFIPFAGDCNGSLLELDDEGLDGSVWSSSVSGSNVEWVRVLNFNSEGYISGDGNARYKGRSVRAVQA